MPASGSVTPASQTPEVINITASRPAFAEDIYVSASKAIVIGTPAKVLAATWDDKREFIYTPVLVTVERQIKGEVLPKEVTVYERGGTVGNVSMIEGDPADVEIGKRYVLFLSDVPGQQNGKLMIIGGLMGAVRMDGDNTFPNRGISGGGTKPEPLGLLISNVEAVIRGEFRPTPTATRGPVPTQVPSGGLYPPKPPEPVKPGE